MTEPLVIMVAPNGARKTKTDHPALPVTIDQTVSESAMAVTAGANAVHAHVRDDAGRHSIDAGLYRELLAEMHKEIPGVPVQITTESAGMFDPKAQASLLAQLRPALASVALREICEDMEVAKRVYHMAHDNGTSLQHILYDANDLARFHHLRACGIIPAQNTALLFVLGRYAASGIAQVTDLRPFIAGTTTTADRWWVCAFGPAENASITHAIAAGGHARVGFENNLWRSDGSLAQHNADLVAEAVASAAAEGRPIASPQVAARLLSVR